MTVIRNLRRDAPPEIANSRAFQGPMGSNTMITCRQVRFQQLQYKSTKRKAFKTRKSGDNPACSDTAVMCVTGTDNDLTTGTKSMTRTRILEPIGRALQGLRPRLRPIIQKPLQDQPCSDRHLAGPLGVSGFGRIFHASKPRNPECPGCRILNPVPGA